ncbi:MAG: YczE/YyaS/YitT family protein [Ilumatobacteraceae bacterium]
MVSPGPASSPRTLRERFLERLARCVLGLAGFGTGIAFFVEANIGVPPWDVFHQGISEKTGLGLGTALIVVAFFVLLLWIPLRLRPGIGTILNAVQIGLVENVVQDMLPTPDNLMIRVLFMCLGMLCIAAGSGLYIGAELGSGPRDGLMLGLNARYGISVRLARTTVEVTVMIIGIFLGGSIGLGTFVFAFGIGPLVQITLSLFKMSSTQIAEAGAEAQEQ